MVARETVLHAVASYRESEITELRARARKAELRADGFVRMVHEIRTLLGGVTGVSGILLDGELADDQRGHVTRLQRSAEALLDVVNGALDFSRLETGGLRIDTADFDVRGSIDDVLTLAAHRADVKGLTLSASVDADVPTNVAGDRVRLRQALLNLVVNAIKFTERGSVTVHVGVADEAARTTDRVVLAIDVVDTGIGIAPEALAHVFEPFQQASGASPDARAEGTGLGLAIVRGFVEAMEGVVSCESELGRGSRFTVKLPLEARASEAAQAPTAPPGPASTQPVGLSALVVEDDALNARVTRHQLQRRGWSVDVVVDGREAVERVQRTTYDVVLLDWHTPRLDGIAAAREIRRGEAPGHHMPLVALTAIATEGAREQCIDAGMDDFLTKPIVQADLDAVLAKVADGTYTSGRRAKGTIAPPPPIDFGVLESLGVDTGGGPSVVAELGRIFSTCASRRVVELREAVSNRDGRAAYLAVHSLRGMCSQMGANALAARFMDLEQLARRSAIPELADMLADVELELEHVLESVGTWLASHDAAA